MKNVKIVPPKEIWVKGERKYFAGQELPDGAKKIWPIEIKKIKEAKDASDS